jgi:hypothetical protein
MKNIFIGLVLFTIILYGCDGKKNAGDITVGQTGLEVSESESPNDFMTEGEPIVLDLQNKPEIADAPVIVEDALPDADPFLSELFPYNDYTVLDEPLSVNYRNIYFAVHYINRSLEVCDTIIGYEIVEGVFHRYLLIQDFKFINEDHSVFLDFSRAYQGIYGFKIMYSYSNNPEYTPGLVIDTYFDKGNRVADGFTIRWNEGIKQFEDISFF